MNRRFNIVMLILSYIICRASTYIIHSIVCSV